MKYFRPLALILIAGLFTLNIYGQDNATLSGTITDAETGMPVPHADIVLYPVEKGMVSNISGAFVMHDLKPGSYTITISHVGYETWDKKIELTSGQKLQISVPLKRSITELSPVEILEDIKRRVPYVRTEIRQLDIEKSASRDIGDFLRQSPNISGIRKGGTAIDPVVRGFKFSQLNVQINQGQKIEGGCPNRMDPAVAHIEIEDIERIEILKGPYAFRYGPSMGGVVHLMTTQPKAFEEYTINVKAIKGYESNWNGDKEYLSVTGGNKRIYYQLSGSNKRYGDYLDGNGDPVKASFHRYNYKAQLGFSPAEGHNILLSWEQSKGRNVDYPALPMDERNDDTELMSADYSFIQPGKRFNSLDVKVYRSDVNHEMDNKNRPFSDTVAAVSIIKAINTGFRAEAGLSLGKGHLFAGVDYENISKDGQRTKDLIAQPMLPVFVEQLWGNALINNLGVFAEYKITSPKYDFVAAARVDMNSATSDDISIEKMMNVIYFSDDNSSEYTNFSISAGVVKKFSQNLSLALSLGRGVRSPDMVERYITLLPIGYDKYDYIGNPKLKPEANHQADLTLKYDKPSFGGIEVNGFYSMVTDFITGRLLPPSEQKPLSNGVLGVKEFYNTSEAYFAGFEFSYFTPADFPLKVMFNAGYTHGTIKEATKQILNENNEVTGEEIIENDALTEIPPMEANLRLSYSFFNDKLEPSLGIRFVAAQNHVSDASYEKESPGFTTLNLGINYTFNKYLFVSGGVNNIFDLAYYEHLNRNIIGSSADFYEPGRIFYVNLIFNISSR